MDVSKITSQNFEINQVISFISSTRFDSVSDEKQREELLGTLFKIFKQHFQSLRMDEQILLTKYLFDIFPYFSNEQLEESITIAYSYLYLSNIQPSSKSEISRFLGLLLEKIKEKSEAKLSEIILPMINEIYNNVKNKPDDTTGTFSSNLFVIGVIIVFVSPEALMPLLEIVTSICLKCPNDQVILSQVGIIMSRIGFSGKNIFSLDSQVFYDLFFLGITKADAETFTKLLSLVSQYVFEAANCGNKSATSLIKKIFDFLYENNSSVDDSVTVSILIFYKNFFESSVSNGLNINLNDFCTNKIFPVLRFVCMELEKENFETQLDIIMADEKYPLSYNLFSLLGFLCIKYDQLSEFFLLNIGNNTNDNYIWYALSVLLPKLSKSSLFASYCSLLFNSINPVTSGKIIFFYTVIRHDVMSKTFSTLASQLYISKVKEIFDSRPEETEYAVTKIFNEMDTATLKNPQNYMVTDQNMVNFIFEKFKLFPENFKREAASALANTDRKIIDYLQIQLNNSELYSPQEITLVDKVRGLLSKVITKENEYLYTDFFDLLVKDKSQFRFGNPTEEYITNFQIYIVGKLAEGKDCIVPNIVKYVERMKQKNFPLFSYRILFILASLKAGITTEEERNYQIRVYGLKTYRDPILPKEDKRKLCQDLTVIFRNQLASGQHNDDLFFNFILITLSLFDFESREISQLATAIMSSLNGQFQMKKITIFHFLFIFFTPDDLSQISRVKVLKNLFSDENFREEELDKISTFELIAIILSYLKIIREISAAVKMDFVVYLVKFLNKLINFFNEEKKKSTYDQDMLVYFHSRQEEEPNAEKIEEPENQNVKFFDEWIQNFKNKIKSEPNKVSFAVLNSNFLQEIINILQSSKTFFNNTEFIAQLNFVIDNVNSLPVFLQSFSSRKIIKIKRN